MMPDYATDIFDANGYFNWDAVFRDAHLHSWPHAGLVISCAEPTSTQKDQGKRNLYREDRQEIHAAALKHGYRVIFKSAKVIGFLRSSNL